MTENTFFQRNTISNWADFKPPESTHKIRSKRANSVSDLKLDPSKFLHRQVFNSKIFQKVNFFNLNLDELKNRKNKQKSQSIQAMQEILNEIKQLIKDKDVMNFTSNILNYWQLVPNFDNKKDIREAILLLINGIFKKMLQSFHKIFTEKQIAEQKIIKMQAQLKSKVKQSDTNMTLISLKELSRLEKQKKQHKTYKQRFSTLDFELKRQILKNQTLSQTIHQQNKLIQELEAQKQAMIKQREEDKHFKQNMNFKITRLKEELQVAHIIKEQNLADKMKYIMNW